MAKDLVVSKKSSTFATANEKYNISRKAFGVLTERLGNGLQNRVERFDSARHLKKEILVKGSLFCFYIPSLLSITILNFRKYFPTRPERAEAPSPGQRPG